MTAFTDLLADFAAEKHFVCHLQPYDTVAAALTDIYLSTHGFISSPSDTPANQFYAERIKTAPEFRRSLWAQGKLSGRSLPGAGTMVFDNSAGTLDGWRAYAWGGRRLRVWLGGKDFALADYGLIFDVTVEGIDFSNQEITLHLRDLQHLFDREFQTARYAGTGGVEGGADLANRLKPRCYGIRRNIELIYLGVVSGKHTFACNDGATIGVLRVRDQGLDLTFVASAPAAGQWTVDCATGIVTLGGAYLGPVTADVIGSRYLSATSATSHTIGSGSKTFTVSAGLALSVGMTVRVGRTSALHSTWMDGKITAYSGTSLTINITSSLGAGTFTDWTISPWGTVAGLLKAIATAMSVTTFDTATFTALDAAQPASVGWWIPQGGNGLQILDDISDRAGAYYGFNRAGELDVGRLAAPSSSVATYDEDLHILKDALQRQRTDEPNYESVVRYRKNHLVMAGDRIAGAVSDADRLFLSTEWRQAKVSDAAVLVAYPLSKPIEIDSILDEEADALAEATRLANLFKVARDYFTVGLKVQPLARELAQTITLEHSRYDLDAGEAFVIVDITEDMSACRVQLGVWG